MSDRVAELKNLLKAAEQEQYDTIKNNAIQSIKQMLGTDTFTSMLEQSFKAKITSIDLLSEDGFDLIYYPRRKSLQTDRITLFTIHFADNKTIKCTFDGRKRGRSLTMLTYVEKRIYSSSSIVDPNYDTYKEDGWDLFVRDFMNLDPKEWRRYHILCRSIFFGMVEAIVSKYIEQCCYAVEPNTITMYEFAEIWNFNGY